LTGNFRVERSAIDHARRYMIRPVVISILFAICGLNAVHSYAQMYPTPGRDPLLPPPRKPHDTTPPQGGSTYIYPSKSDIRTTRILKDNAHLLYREPTKEELASIAVTEEDLAIYKSEPGARSGIFRLAADGKCDEPDKGPLREAVCSKYSMPGNGSSYSFRTNGYRIARLADLRYTEDGLRAGSRFTMGIMGQLGDSDLESISTGSHGVRQVAGFSAPTDLKGIEQQYYKLEAGFNIGGYFYSNLLPLNVGKVYVLRSIAFRGTNPQAVRDIIYDESKFDKRIDILIVFKVVRKPDDGSIIIHWRELRNQASPKLAEKKV
jgi:hypothetical protein